MIVETTSERISGHDIEVQCPSCDRETTALTYELLESLTVFGAGPLLKSRHTWVQCTHCGERRLSQVPPKRLQTLNAWQLAQLLGGDVPPRAKQLTITALATCLIPLIGLILGVLAVLDTLKVQSWPKLASRVGLALALIANVGFAALGISKLIPQHSAVPEKSVKQHAPVPQKTTPDAVQRALAYLKPGLTEALAKASFKPANPSLTPAVPLATPKPIPPTPPATEPVKPATPVISEDAGVAAEPMATPTPEVMPAKPQPASGMPAPLNDPDGVAAEPQTLPDEITPPAPAPSVKAEVGTGWRVIFSGRDPEVWNTAGSADTLAKPLASVARDVRWLRLKRLDTAESIIIPITFEQLNTKLSYRTVPKPTVRWNGGNENAMGGRHLGIAEGRIIEGNTKPDAVAIQTEGLDFVSGSGFGHLSNDLTLSQQYAWRGQKIPPTAFEIAVSSGNLTTLEQTLTNQMPR